MLRRLESVFQDEKKFFEKKFFSKFFSKKIFFLNILDFSDSIFNSHWAPVSFPHEQMKKNAVKMSFYVLIKSYILTRLTRVIKGRPAEYQYEALKPEKKSFSQKLKISLLQSEKSLFISLKLKKRKKKHFLVKSALSFQPVTAKRLVKGFLK